MGRQKGLLIACSEAQGFNSVQITQISSFCRNPESDSFQIPETLINEPIRAANKREQELPEGNTMTHFKHLC